MSSFFKKHGISNILSTKGKLFILDKEHPEVKFRLKHSATCPEFMSFATSKAFIELNQESPVKANEKVNEMLAEYLICGWEGLKWEGEKVGQESDLVYSKQAALKILKDAVGLGALIASVCNNPRNFVDSDYHPKPTSPKASEKEAEDQKDPKKKYS